MRQQTHTDFDAGKHFSTQICGSEKNYEITDAYIRWENLILVYAVQGGVPNVPFLNNS